MDLKEIIRKRRAYRFLEPVEIKKELIRDLAECAQLAPSCFNNQPWRFVFIHEKKALEEIQSALSSGNAWATPAAMIIAVFSKLDADCQIKGREYYLFDTGMATAFIILRLTELGLVAHPIAGYDENKAKEILKIPEEMKLITFIVVGKKTDKPTPVVSEKQIQSEATRPARIPIEKFAFYNYYEEK